MTLYGREAFTLVMPFDGEPTYWKRTTERVVQHNRLPYSPTPVNPYKFSRDGVLYMDASLDTLEDILEQWEQTEQAQNAPAYIRNLMSSSVRGALIWRFQEANNIEVSPGMSPGMFHRGEMGNASPIELITLVDQAQPDTNPRKLRSAELAKWSGPGEWDVPEGMEMAIAEALEQVDFVASEDPEVRYIFAGADDMQNPNAVNIVRKVNLGIIHGENGPIQVVKRDSYLIDLNGDFDGRDDVRKECRRFISGAKDSLDGKPVRYDRVMLPVILDEGIEKRAGYVYPAVRSYYIHELDE